MLVPLVLLSKETDLCGLGAEVVASDNIIIVCMYCFLSFYAGDAVVSVAIVRRIIYKLDIGAVAAIALILPFV